MNSCPPTRTGWQPRLIWISIGGFVFFPVLEAAKRLYAPKGAELHIAPMDTQYVLEELEEADLKRAKRK